MDIFCEYLVEKKKNATDYLLMFLAGFGAVILSAVIFMFNRYLFGFDIFLFAGVLFGAYLLIKSRSIEYEYTLTSNELDIDKIIGKRKRKRMMTIDFKYIEVCAKIDDERYLSQYNHKPENVTDVTGISTNDIYFVDFSASAGRQRVLFQPSEKMKESLRLVNPGAVHLS